MPYSAYFAYGGCVIAGVVIGLVAGIIIALIDTSESDAAIEGRDYTTGYHDGLARRWEVETRAAAAEVTMPAARGEEG